MKHLKFILNSGFKLIPLKVGSDAKEPRDSGYASRTYTLNDLEGNVGLLVPQGLVDVDFDWPEASPYFGSFMPGTHMVFGRRKRITHAIYRSELSAPVTFKLPKVENFPLSGPHAYTVLELRTAKADEPYHVMIPPSVHPDGDKLEWARDRDDVDANIEPAQVDPNLLLEKAGQLAAFAVLLRFYPGEGSRDEFALALTGALARGNWDDESIERFIGLLATEAHDEEASTRKSKVLRARQKLENGRPVYGLTSLAKIMGVPYEWVAEIAVWLGLRQRHSNGPAIFDNGVVRDIARQAWQRLEEYVIDNEPAVYAYGEAIARIDRKRIEVLDKNKLTHELNRCAKWLRPSKDKHGNVKWLTTNAKGSVVDDMLAARGRDVTVPPLVSISNVPVFTRTGRLIQDNGYDEESQIFLDLDVRVQVPDRPTRRDVRRGLRQLYEPIWQFPYADKSDKVNALALTLEPYLRDILECTPLYFVNKPAPGTGATLFLGTVLFPALGGLPEAGTPPIREEEMEKVLTTKFKEGARVIFFDNADSLASPSLAAAITAGVFTGRILGKSQSVRVPVRCVWAASGNNTEMTDELYRRTVDIRMDADMEHPEDRPVSSFRIKDLKQWSKDNRERQVGAALTIIQFWVNEGMPRGGASKASFETWSSVMSGIFDVINVRGFLETPKDRRPVDPILEETKAVILSWFNLMRNKVEVPHDLSEHDFGKPVKAVVIAEMIDHLRISFDMQHKDPARAVGERLRRYKSHTFEFESTAGKVYRIKLKSRSINGSLSWWLDVEVGAEEILPAPVPF